jgi:hypothetical protein
MKDPAEIIRSKKKGFRLARASAKRATLAEADEAVVAKSPSLEDLKAKFLPQDMDGATAASANPADDQELEMVQVEPDTDTGADPDGPGTKSVIISRQSGEILGEQG